MFIIVINSQILLFPANNLTIFSTKNKENTRNVCTIAKSMLNASLLMQKRYFLKQQTKLCMIILLKLNSFEIVSLP